MYMYVIIYMHMYMYMYVMCDSNHVMSTLHVQEFVLKRRIINNTSHTAPGFMTFKNIKALWGCLWAPRGWREAQVKEGISLHPPKNVWNQVHIHIHVCDTCICNSAHVCTCDTCDTCICNSAHVCTCDTCICNSAHVCICDTCICNSTHVCTCTNFSSIYMCTCVFLKPWHHSQFSVQKELLKSVL